MVLPWTLRPVFMGPSGSGGARLGDPGAWAPSGAVRNAVHVAGAVGC